MIRLPQARTWRGMRLDWRGEPLRAEDPRSAWEGLLHNRGLSESDAFFSPRLADLPDPEGMKDMTVAADRVTRAIRDREPIHIFGDFDADGVIGTAILVEALASVGAQVSSSIPDRVADGHGIVPAEVERAAAAGAKVGISVDTGTLCIDACRRAAELGMDMIVTDHHLPGAILPPALAVLNPARPDCGFADRKLCGSGVAFFLLMAVWKRLRRLGHPVSDLRSLLDRVAVATVADVMELVGVNRILVHHGLGRLNAAPSPGLAALMRVARARRQADVELIAFQLAPRINAAGRMQHGEDAMRLLACRDPQQALRLAEVLDRANAQRRKVEAEVFRQAEARVAVDECLAVYDGDWHAGVVGLVAGRLARKHGRPAAVGFVTADGSIRVSLRGRPGFHVGEILQACRKALKAFGGHAGAGGGTVAPGCWDRFRNAFEDAVRHQREHAGEHAVLPIDGELTMDAVHYGLAERIERFAPFGHGNPACLWLLRDVEILGRRDLRGGTLRLQLGNGRRTLDAVAFQAQGLNRHLLPGKRLSLIGQLQRDRWQGGTAVQWVIEDGCVAEGT